MTQEKSKESLQPGIIAVDFDDTLAETVRGLLGWGKLHIKNLQLSFEEITTITLSDVSHYGVAKWKGILGFVWFCYFSRAGKEMLPCEEVKTTLEELKKKGYRFVLVTARPNIFWCKTRTKKWIEKNIPGLIDEMYFAKIGWKRVKKYEICQQIGAKMLIEDNPQNCKECDDHHIKSLLLEKPWNKNFDEERFPLVKKVKSWKNVADCF